MSYQNEPQMNDDELVDDAELPGGDFDYGAGDFDRFDHAYGRGYVDGLRDSAPPDSPGLRDSAPPDSPGLLGWLAAVLVVAGFGAAATCAFGLMFRLFRYCAGF